MEYPHSLASEEATKGVGSMEWTGIAYRTEVSKTAPPAMLSRCASHLASLPQNGLLDDPGA